MINRIIHYSLHNRLIILLGVVLVVLGGYFSAQKMDIDVFPDLTAPTVVLMTDTQGMTAEETERLVTFPIETAVNGATDVRRVRSSSMAGYSFVWVEFDWGTDIYRARQTVNEKMLALDAELPEGITPVMAPQSSVMGEILFVSMQAADSISMMDLRTLADWVVKPAILATGGVAQVTVIGGEVKEYQVLADIARMQAYGVTMDELETAVAGMSQNSTGGVLREYGNEYAMRGMGRTGDLQELASTFVKSGPSQPITVGDVAQVKIGSAVRMGMASCSGTPAIILSISKQPNVNTLEVTEQIENNLHGIQRSLPADVHLDTHVFRQADFIESSVRNVGRALLEGAIFVVIVLFLFLGNFRTTIISVVAIPMSLLATLIVIYTLGMDVNTMTLGGMCIAIGSLVDDAIIDVENVYKRLRENRLRPQEERLPAVRIVFDASCEIRSSILNATFIIMVAFVPLFFLSGMEGRMLKPLGLSFIIALFMSLVVAMTLTPLLCRMILTGDGFLQSNTRVSRVSAWLSAHYYRSLTWALGHHRIVFRGTLVAFVLSVGLFLSMGNSFLPEFNEGSAVVTAVAQPGVSLEVNGQLGRLIEEELLKVPEVYKTARRTGRGELDEHSQATNSSEIEVGFHPSDRSREEIFNEMRARMASVPGVVSSIGQPLGHRIDHMLSGSKANIAIKLFGTDLSRMFILGNHIRNSIEGIDGLVDVSVEQQTETPQLQIRARRQALAQYGISMQDFNRYVESAFPGVKLGDIYEGQRRFDLVLRLDSNYVATAQQVRRSLIDTGFGSKVALEDVADIVSVGGPNSISRENVQRKLVVQANVSGRDVGSAVQEIQRTLDSQIELPEGYRIEYGGQFESAQSARRTLMVTTFIAILVIFLLLYGEFQEASLSLIVLMGLPLALIGGVFAVYFTSGVVSIPSIIGFITLFGVATRNGILLVSRYRHMQQEGQSLSDTIIQGSVDRLNPILMTALTSALALVPLVFNGDAPGNEIQSPMAVVVLGGLVSSTLLNIFLMPLVYRWYVQRTDQKEKHESIGARKSDALSV
ncbi:MAG: efflux RND transporter permease subunit [Bacteroidaceae bacterium]